ncbi:hypothetical protein MYCTH_2307901 [Thermothelomyces thermophilus ATCC 42464]|uniref:Uncharacterized protein n=1 Tax=Thermothelomyces thermophilus (strain ATCC 42464 / BCRC 31852 / DSM 1799) TaxID=573729 RepID=G2QIJ4_THET4|nr:uncharacterized protein MYCTH_2307901 [Thermothelomyces thermophilus ATCC 42464]AEO59525.1 hypothetical protein MYCTH_2307901 [Thermothelomyces thermophilus ATCC 42464]
MHQPPEEGRANGTGEQIELQPGSMGRGRGGIPRGRGAKKRTSLPSHSYSNYSAEAHPFSDSAKPSTPEPSSLPPPQRMAYTAPQRGGKARQVGNMTTPHRASSPAADQALRIAAAKSERPPRSSTFHSFSFSGESPSTAGSIMAAGDPPRKRSRTFEASYDGGADDEGHSKGGHSLRKRARIDYTQEMVDDDLGLPAGARTEPAVKPASTPGARGSRKRKGGQDESDEESEDFSSNPKRHRADKSPAPARLSSSRRRNPSKKLSADLTPFVDQASDNEVQDTILVSVPDTGPDAPSEEDSERSVQDAESRPASSDGSEPGRTEVPSPTPQVQQHPSSVHHDAAPRAVDGEPIREEKNPEQPHDEPHKAPVLTSATIGSAEAEQPMEEEGPVNENQPSGVSVPEVAQDVSAQTVEVGPGQQSLEQPNGGDDEPSHQGPAATEPTTGFTKPTPTPAPEPQLAVDSTAQRVPQGDGHTESRTSSFEGSKPAGPTRLKALEHIYKIETPFAIHLKLTPYEDEDTPLPGPYTEWVYPAKTGKAESSPAPAAVATLSTAKKKTVDVEWDPSRPLKASEFFALYRKESKRRQEKGEPTISMVEFNNECVRRYKAANAQRSPSDTPPSTTESTASPTVVIERSTAADGDETPSDSQPDGSRLPTAAPSPAPAEDATALGDAPEDDQDVEESIDDPAKPDSPEEPIEVTRIPPKQYLFPKIRDPNEFVEAFEGWQDMPTERLYETVAAAVEALHVYQQEYNELKKILDDEENAKRRQANDKTIVNWENRQRADEPLPPRRHFDDPVKGPPAFEVRGMRASKPYIDDMVLEHQKEEDRIMANAYGFKLNTHPTQVGRQNPEEQRWDMLENRLRKRTEKGAELAEENVVEGKRIRKPRHVSDQSKDVSRSGTPTGTGMLGPGRRQRRKPATAANGEDAEDAEQNQASNNFSESPRKGRAARSRPAMRADDQDQIPTAAEADGNRTEDEDAEAEDRTKVSRRRGRAAAAPLPEPPTSVPAGVGGELGKPKRVRGGKGSQANHQTKGEIASSSFYSNASTQPESRPSTASSESSSQTAETMESTYSLRDKRRRNFALENDPELESRPQRRARGTAAPKQDAAPEPIKKRGPKKKEPAAQAPPPPPVSGPSSTPRPSSPPALQPPVATKFYHNFVAGPMMVDVGNGTQQHVPAQVGPYLHTFNAAPAFLPGAHPQAPPPPAVKKPITKIKLTNNNGTSSSAPSRASTPANGTSTNTKPKRARGKKGKAGADTPATNGDGELDKPYAEMTKSEKMSWSMRRRWASGEMQGAVEKRRTTLAIKKAEKAASNLNHDTSDANATNQTTDSGSAGPSNPATPASMHGQPGSGLLALPQGPPMMLPHPPPPQGFLHQPSYPYSMPPPSGPPRPMP